MDSVLQVFKGNAEKAVRLITAAVPKIAERAWDEEKKKLKVRTQVLEKNICVLCTISVLFLYMIV